MSAWQAWKRLLWREFREGAPVILIAIIAPVIFFKVGAWFTDESWQRGLFAVPAAAGVHLAIAVWAAGRGSGKKTGSEFSHTHLPMSPVIDWAASLAVPLAVCAVLGLWFGWLVASVLGHGEALRMSLAGALDMAATYAVCYFIAAIISNWAAVAMGVVRVVGGTAISVWDLRANTDADAVALVLRMIIGATVGAYLFAALSGKRSFAYRQAASLLLMIAIVFLPMVTGIKGWDYAMSSLGLRNQEYGAHIFISPIRTGDDVVSVSEVSNRQADNTSFYRLTNQRSRLDVVRGFYEDIALLDVLSNNRVYFAQHREGVPGIQILEWNADANAVKCLTTLDVPAGAFMGIHPNYEFHRVSPDGRYLLISLKSLMNAGYDLWAVDLRTGRSAVVEPKSQGMWRNEDVSWQENRAILWNWAYAKLVDFRKMTAADFCLPGNKGG